MAKVNQSGNLNQRIDNLERRIKALEKSMLEKDDEKITVVSENLNVTIPIQVTSDKTVVPTYANVGDAGFDFRSDQDYYISPGCTVMIKTGLRIALPKGYELQIRPRSGISLKTDLRVANAPGTIDAGYRGEICILLTNIYRFKNINARVVDINGVKIDRPPKGYPKLTYFIKKGDRIAQGVISKIYHANFTEVVNIEDFESSRGSGGFGSSGTR